MVAMPLNSPTYVLVATTSSANEPLQPDAANQTSLVIWNSGTAGVHLTSSKGAAIAAVIPASGAPTIGKTIPPGAVETFTKNAGDNFLNGISISGTNTLYIGVGCGE